MGFTHCFNSQNVTQEHLDYFALVIIAQIGF
uniref:Uncharacterized protein n=1 Tax=Anguilla anguilla TaxID=7936 RepID=A0A0E9PC20_ANGAN